MNTCQQLEGAGRTGIFSLFDMLRFPFFVFFSIFHQRTSHFCPAAKVTKNALESRLLAGPVLTRSRREKPKNASCVFPLNGAF
jgi:hypothetical protein